MLNNTLFEVEKRLMFRDGTWRVRTREIPELGPFGSKEEAVDALHRHVIACESSPGPRERGMESLDRHSIVTCKEPACQKCEDILALCPESVRVQLRA